MNRSPMDRPLRLAGLACALALVPGLAGAQIVNVHSRFSEAPEDGFAGGLTASVDLRAGNTDLLLVQGGLNAQHRAGPSLVMALAQGDLGLSNDQRIVAKALEHVRYRYLVTPAFEPEIFVQHELDEFRRLGLRALVGAGPRLNLLSRENLRLSLGVAAMLEHERYNDDGQADAGTSTTDVRLSSYAVARAQLTERVVLVETLYVQPRIDRFSDLRMLNESHVAVSVTEHVALAIAFVLAWDRAPPAGVEPLDLQLKTALVLKL